MGARTEEGEGDSLPRAQPGFRIKTFLKAELSTVKGAVKEELTPYLKRCAEIEEPLCSAQHGFFFFLIDFLKKDFIFFYS